MKATIWDKELKKINKDEEKYIKSVQNKKVSSLNKKIEQKIPEKLDETIKLAFLKAFDIIFQKGTILIEKTYKKDKMSDDFKINNYILDVKENSKAIKNFNKSANGAANKNVMLSGVRGAGLGLLGVGIPDIPLFLATILKGIYEISLSYGYDYADLNEKYFILNIINSSVLYGSDFEINNNIVNEFIDTNKVPDDYLEQSLIENLSNNLANEVLCMKFLQGIAVIGVVGGAFDVIFTQKILKYTKLKYHRRYIKDKIAVRKG